MLDVKVDAESHNTTIGWKPDKTTIEEVIQKIREKGDISEEISSLILSNALADLSQVCEGLMRYLNTMIGAGAGEAFKNLAVMAPGLLFGEIPEEIKEDIRNADFY